MTIVLLGWLTIAAEAGPADRALPPPDVKASSDILLVVKAKGFSPFGTPVRQGDYYVLQAMDPNGAQVRIITDTLYGDILSVTRTTAEIPRVEGEPRIIKVPLSGERLPLQVAAKTHAERIVSPPDVGKTMPKTPPTTSPRIPPRRVPYSKTTDNPASKMNPASGDLASEPKAQAAQAPTRTVLSAPALPLEGLSPIRPLPRWRETGPRPVEAPPGSSGVAAPAEPAAGGDQRKE